LWVEDLRVERIIDPNVPAAGEQDASIRVYFVLPKGAYATTVLSSAVDWQGSGGDGDVREAESE
jgi:tRNA(Glu) U13 pseudouridine synthase TruD